MNEFLFFYHVLAVFCFILGALRLGKNALITIIAIQGVLANFFIFKQIKIFGLNVTATDVFAVGGILALNLLVEFFGKEIAKKAVWITFFTSIFCCVMGIFHILYVPSVYDINHQNYAAIFSFMPRVIISSLIVYFAVQRFDVFFYSFLRRKFKWKYPTILNVSSLMVSQLLDTILFSFIGLYGIVASLKDIIFMSLIIKFIIIVFSSPFIFVVSKLFRGRHRICRIKNLESEKQSFSKLKNGKYFENK